MTLLSRPRQKSFGSAHSNPFHAPFHPSAINIHTTAHSRANSVPTEESYAETSSHNRSKSWVTAFRINSNSQAEPRSGWDKEGSAGGTLLRKMKKTLAAAYEGDGAGVANSDPTVYYPRPPESALRHVNNGPRGLGIGVVSIVGTPAEAFEKEDDTILITAAEAARDDESPPPATPLLPSEPPVSVFPSVPRNDRRKGYTSSGGALAEWQAELAEIESNWKRQSSQSTPESSPRRRRLSAGSRPKIIPHLHLGNVVAEGSESETNSPPKKVLATSSSVPENLNNIWDDFLAEAELTFDEDNDTSEHLVHLPPMNSLARTSSLLSLRSPPVSPSKQSPKRRSNRHSVLLNPLPVYPTQYLDSLLPPSPTKAKLLFPSAELNKGTPDADAEEDVSGGSELFLSAFPSPPLAAANVFTPLLRPPSDVSDTQVVPRPVSGVSSIAERRAKVVPNLVIVPRGALTPDGEPMTERQDGHTTASTSAHITDRSYFSPATPQTSALHGDNSPWSAYSTSSSASSAGGSEEKDRTITLPILRGLAITGSQVDLLESDEILPSSRAEVGEEEETVGVGPHAGDESRDHLFLHRVLDSTFSPFSTPSLGGSVSSTSSHPSSDTEFSLSPYAHSDGSFSTDPPMTNKIASDSPMVHVSKLTTHQTKDEAWEYAERQLNRAVENLPPFLSDLESDFDCDLSASERTRDGDDVVLMGRSWLKKTSSLGSGRGGGRVRLAEEVEEVEEMAAVVEFGLAF